MPDDERIEETVESALRRKADAAPEDRGLAARVRARLARRRRRQVAGATVACIAVIAGGFAGFAQLDDTNGDRGRDVAGPDRSDEPGEPDDWRWESYGGIEVRVPDAWGYGVTGQPPCLQDRGQPPYVGRPGVIAMIACPDPIPPLDRRVPYLWFDSAEPTGVREYDAGWAAETRRLRFMTVTVLAGDADLRGRILDSMRVVDRTDSYGCPVEHAVIGEPDASPTAVDGGLATVGDVDSISVCRYTRPSFAIDPDNGPLLSASRLTGPEARQLVDDILAAPEGTGPNDPGHCTPDAMHGEEVLLLRVRGSAHDQEVYVRYDGCDGHGTDDGMTLRQLTGPVLRALLASAQEPGPHRPSGLQGPVARLAGWR